MNLTGTHVTIMVCTIAVLLAVLVGVGKVVIPVELVEKVGALVLTFLGGLALKRPKAMRKLLGLPVATPEIPISYDPPKGQR